jgi:surfeit locus 1 family protein
MRGRQLYVLLIASLIGVLILLSLGFWQLERREWKQALVTSLERAVSGETQVLSLLQAEEIIGRDPSQDYLPLTVKGTFDHANERFLFSVLNGEPGWHVITPLVTRGGRIVLVDRGFVPDALRAVEKRPEGMTQNETEMRGLLRKSRMRGLFTPANQPGENIWYWPDVPALIASLPPRRQLEFSRYIVEALPGPNALAWPRPAPPEPAAIPDNHLQYALTWFALALVLVVMTFLLARRPARSPGPPGPSP